LNTTYEKTVEVAVALEKHEQLLALLTLGHIECIAGGDETLWLVNQGGRLVECQTPWEALELVKGGGK
jgi:hypothetical protein